MTLYRLISNLEEECGTARKFIQEDICRLCISDREKEIRMKYLDIYFRNITKKIDKLKKSIG